MRSIYIFGHKKPDTDSICSSIAFAYFKNELGYKAEPRTLGSLNNETKFVLKTFDLKEPKYLHDVKVQISDLYFKKDCYITENSSINDSYNYMKENGLSGIPIIDENKKLSGLVTLKEIAKELIEGEFNKINTSFDHLLKTLQGKAILRFEEEIIGNVFAVTFKSTTFVSRTPLDQNSIVIVGNRRGILEYAINSKIKLLIIVGDGTISEKHLLLAKQNKINIIKTPFDSFKTAKLINLSNYIKTVSYSKEPISFELNNYLSEFEQIAMKYKHTNYPIVNSKKECVGLLRMTGIIDKKPKQVILMDHNEKEQSVDFLEEAQIIEVVDHHKLGSISTNSPIDFRNMAVGSTCTIVYNIFKENKIAIPKQIAGAMLSGIISDTLLLQSPTTTILDKSAIFDLQKIAKVNYLDYGQQMFKAGSSLVGKTKEQIIFHDFKKFTINEKFVGIGQITTTDVEVIINELDEYVKLLNDISNNQGYKVVSLFVTDVINNGSYIIYNDSSKLIFENVLNISLKQGMYLPKIVSRKKQIIPILMEVLEKK